MKKIRKILIGIIVVLITSSYLYFLCADTNDLSFTSLTPTFPKIAKEKNSFYYFQKAVNSLQYQPVKLSRKDKIDYSAIKKLLNKNKTSFSYFARASQLTAYSLPREYLAEQNATVRYKKIRQLAKLRFGLFLSHMFKKDPREAIDEALLLLKWGHRIQHGNGPLVHFISGSLFKMYGYKAVLQLVNFPGMNSGLIKKLFSGLRPFVSFEEGLINSLKIEFYNNSSAVDSFTKNNKQSRIAFKPHATKKMFAEHVSFVINNINSNWKHVKSFEKDGLFFVSDTYQKSLPFENPAGKKFYKSHIFSTRTLFSVVYAERFYKDALFVVKALREYKAQHKKLPGSLNKLVPQYLSSIPLDMYDGKKLKYSQKLGIVYSVGENLVDDGVGETLKCRVK